MAGEGKILYTEYSEIKKLIDDFRTLVNQPYSWRYAPTQESVNAGTATATADTVNELESAATDTTRYTFVSCSSQYTAHKGGHNSGNDATHYGGRLSGNYSGYDASLYSSHNNGANSGQRGDYYYHSGYYVGDNSNAANSSGAACGDNSSYLGAQLSSDCSQTSRSGCSYNGYNSGYQSGVDGYNGNKGLG